MEIRQTTSNRALEVVAHRGVAERAPENTLPAFLQALAVGADAIELDVRLTRDRVPVVHHYYYLDEVIALSGPIYDYTLDQLRAARLRISGDSTEPASADGWRIPTLTDVLDTVGGQIGLEIEIKGPEPEAPGIVAEVLAKYRQLWDGIEVTSYEPMLLRDIQQRCPGLATDLLMPRSPDWMREDVLAYEAIHRGQLAGARAVHLQARQLSSAVISSIRSHGLDIHAWDVNDEQALGHMLDLSIKRVCTDNARQMVNAVRRMLSPTGGRQSPCDAG
ncbi:MAG: hypothetical protein CL878_06115 [Dehalococcoidia bacterium]|nr:hypothetical protein [Dehalococcoidia bacterium]